MVLPVHAAHAQTSLASSSHPQWGWTVPSSHCACSEEPHAASGGRSCFHQTSQRSDLSRAGRQDAVGVKHHLLEARARIRGKVEGLLKVQSPSSFWPKKCCESRITWNSSPRFKFSKRPFTILNPSTPFQEDKGDGFHHWRAHWGNNCLGMFSQEAVDSGKYNCISKYKVWVSRFIADIGVFCLVGSIQNIQNMEDIQYWNMLILWYCDIPYWSMLTLWIAECLVWEHIRSLSTFPVYFLITDGLCQSADWMQFVESRPDICLFFFSGFCTSLQ